MTAAPVPVFCVFSGEGAQVLIVASVPRHREQSQENHQCADHDHDIPEQHVDQSADHHAVVRFRRPYEVGGEIAGQEKELQGEFHGRT
jgi:hypothetical protein